MQNRDEDRGNQGLDQGSRLIITLGGWPWYIAWKTSGRLSPPVPRTLSRRSPLPYAAVPREMKPERTLYNMEYPPHASIPHPFTFTTLIVLYSRSTLHHLLLRDHITAITSYTGLFPHGYGDAKASARDREDTPRWRRRIIAGCVGSWPSSVNDLVPTAMRTRVMKLRPFIPSPLYLKYVSTPDRDQK